MERRLRNAVLLICLITLAGCNGFPGDEPETPPTTEQTTFIGETPDGSVETTLTTTGSGEELRETTRDMAIEQTTAEETRTITTTTTVTTESNGHTAQQPKRPHGMNDRTTSTVSQSDGDGNDGAIGKSMGVPSARSYIDTV